MVRGFKTGLRDACQVEIKGMMKTILNFFDTAMPATPVIEKETISR